MIEAEKAVARFLVACLFALFMSACAATRMTETWVDPAFHGGPLKKIAVFVVYDDDTVRRLAENQAVAHLPAPTQAVASYTLFPNLRSGERERIRARLLAEGFDGALVTRLVSVERDETYVPPHSYFLPLDPITGAQPYYYSFDNYYGFVQGQVYTTRGYLREDVTAKIESKQYTLADSKPVWSATSESVNPHSAERVAHRLAELIAKDLRGHGIVGDAR